MSRLWTISYDIGDDRIRRQVHALLKDYGERVQYSVFECWLDSNDLSRLRADLQTQIESDDSVRWYPLCAWCSKAVSWQGKGVLPEDSDFYLL